MRERLRAEYTADQLKVVYSTQYDHSKWADHRDRIIRTIEFGKRSLPGINSLTDLSCGDAAIPKGLHSSPVLGDFVSGYQFCGKIEDTVELIEPTDAFVLSETLEHVTNPDWVLTRIRVKAQRLLLSTPCNETLPNPEHYWKWSAAGVAVMLENAGWTPTAMTYLEYPDLDVRYQMWACR